MNVIFICHFKIVPSLLPLKFRNVGKLTFQHNFIFQMIINYHFHFTHEDENYSVFFYSKDYRDPTAHSSNHALRRSWARRLPRSMNWAPLETNHPYVDFLHENQLFYELYCVFKYENSITIFIR